MQYIKYLRIFCGIMNRQSFIISLRVQVVVSCLLSSFFFLSENGYASEQVTFIENPTDNATATVRGRVVDTNGEPLIGATIREKGGANGTVSDIDGSFFCPFRIALFCKFPLSVMRQWKSK